MGRLIPFILIIIMALVSFQGHADDQDKDQDQDRALQLREAGKILSLEKILGLNIKGHVLEVEIEREHEQLIYEIKILDDQGRVWELKIDASTGKIIEQEQD